MQYCCSQLRTKEMLDDAKDDLWWKPNFAQRYSASWNIVQVGGQTSPTLVSVGSATMLRDVASVWAGIKDTNGGSENKNCSVCTLETYNAELILWSIIFIQKFFTWASQREPKFKNALRFCCYCFLSWVTNRRLGPNTRAGISNHYSGHGLPAKFSSTPGNSTAKKL